MGTHHSADDDLTQNEYQNAHQQGVEYLVISLVEFPYRVFFQLNRTIIHERLLLSAAPSAAGMHK